MPIFGEKTIKLFGVDLEVKPAPEPSNLIFEHFEIDQKQRNRRKLRSFSLMALFFFLIFSLFTYLKNIGQNVMNKYPTSISCEDFENIDLSLFEDIAADDKPFTMKGKGNGVYQCYCIMHGSGLTGWKKDHLCYDYSVDKLIEATNSNVITISIVVLNQILRTINIQLIRMIGLPYESEQIMSIMTAIFYS